MNPQERAVHQPAPFAWWDELTEELMEEPAEEPMEEDTTRGRADTVPTNEGDSDNMDLVEVTDLPRPSGLNARVKIGKSDMTHVEDRRYSQFLLHDIQNELREGDTLVFVDFPTPSKPANNVDCFICAWNSVQFRMPSEKLLATGSTRFAEMLNPTYQYRIQRRRKVVNKLPPGVKYVLDLTPPSEGDELVFQITETSLTPGVISWWTSYDKHAIDDYVVSGHDDVCSCWRDKKAAESDDFDLVLQRISESEVNRDEGMERDPEMNQAIKTAIAKSLRDVIPVNKAHERIYIAAKGWAAKLLEKKSRGETAPEPVPDYRNIPDYCPVRHRVNILRLMCIIADKRVLIDSAPRVWTLVAVAKILDCASVVRDSVLQWIMSPNNTVFIEVLPEESLKLGVTLKLTDITRSAFRILVNELALEEAAGSSNTPKAAAYTVFGRKRRDPGDDLYNLIQHAARAMVERVSRPVNLLVSDTIYDDLMVPEWLRLQKLIGMLESRPDDLDSRWAKISAVSLAGALKKLWKKHVVHNLLQKPLDADVLTKIDDHRATYVDIQHFNRFEFIYNQFNNVQKALCPFMYECVGRKWNYIGCGFTQSSTQPNFYRMAGDLWQILQKILMDNHEFVRDPAWQEVLNLQCYDPNDRVERLTLEDMISGSHNAFDPRVFEDTLHPFLRPFYDECSRLGLEIQMNMTPHLLLNLHQDELKFLPLWAGGNDDGTGGVFEPSLPPADYGPAGPGPAYHTGITIPSDASSTAGSVSSVLRDLRLGGGSTIGPGSVDVQDGISTVFNPNKVVADDISIRSESFTDGGSDYGNARFAVLADGQSIADAVGAVVLDETPDRSDAGTSATLEDGDDLDEVMTEMGPEDSISREATPEYVVAGSGAYKQPSLHEGKQSAPAPSAKSAASSSLLDDDDDLVMV